MPVTRRFYTALFVLVWASCAWFGSLETNSNQATRLFVAVELVERGRATIDDYAPLTIDQAVFGGHIYGDKAPGMTIMAMPAVWLADRATGADAGSLVKSYDSDAFVAFVRLRTRIAVAIGPAVLTALAALALFDLALGLTGRAMAALVATIGYAMGTPIWGWSTTLFGHAVVAALYVIAVWAIWRATRDGRAGPAAVAGAALGWAVVVEHQAVLGGVPIGIWALVRIWPRADRWRMIGIAAVAGCAALVPFVLYNLAAFGTVFRIGYQGVEGFPGVKQGFFGLTAPNPAVLVQIVFGSYRGLFWVAPVLLFAPFGLVRLARERGTRGLGVVAIAVCVAVLLVNASYVYWDGGDSTGPRHAMPMVGLLALGLAPIWGAARKGRVVIAALLGVSVAINACVASAEIFALPIYDVPVWSTVIAGHFAHGDLRTVASDYWGWSPWAGFALWLAFAGAMLGGLIGRCRRYDSGGG